ncbi:acyltransferase family protein [Pedobacter mendelii]|uniref:Acyltransferase 3 domain-containing protein n=1 Tax=Pedobacter mendelii TaxID=1908240 RepID=A0ABQ2BFH3_9SPHI|nr:acyltransferase [Pedobacter mendelii]GGI22901.1 hypothetical protein GCM10008119_04960 [Pedobacter mendelii]
MEKAEQNLVDPAHKKNFDFIDSIRCIAMIGIVMEHSVYNGTYIFDGFPPNHIIYICLIQLSKFGTIAFFVLAGFLLGDKFTTYSSWEYFKRRLSNTFKPWLFWSLLFVLLLVLQRWVALHRDGDFHLIPQLKDKFEMVYLYTNYWFIINFLFCIAILLCFKKYLYNFWLGAVLLVCSLLYSTNVYFEWFIPTHTIAIFGFIFYLWLGTILNRHWSKIELWINKASYIIFALFFVSTFVWSVFDITYLIKARSVDPYNTLRISNIVFSIAAILLLFKIKKFGFVKYLKPRETTFGVYLIHYIVLTVILSEIYRPFHFDSVANMNVINMILYVTSRFIFTYGITILLIYFINKTKFMWIIGR